MTFRPRSFMPPTSFGALPGNGPIAGYTYKYNLNLVNFDWVTWHNYEWENWVVVDALLQGALGGIIIRGAWKPYTAYALNDIVVDTRDGSLLIAVVGHTSTGDLDADKALGWWNEYDIHGAPVIISATAPINSLPGDLWWSTVDPVGLFIWYNDGNSSQWVQTNGGSGTPDLPLTGGTLSGPLYVESAFPIIGISEADQVDPIGRYRFNVENGVLALQKAATPFWATLSDVWSVHDTGMHVLTPLHVTGDAPFGLKMSGNYPTIWFHDTTPTGNADHILTAGNGSVRVQVADGAGAALAQIAAFSGSFIDFNAPVTVTAVPGFVARANPPTLRFEETDQADPIGRYQMWGASGNFALSKSSAAGWASVSAVFDYIYTSDAFTVYADFNTTGATHLGQVGGIVKVGHSTVSEIEFKRNVSPFLNYMTVPNGCSLRVQNASSVAWATVSGTGGWSAGSDARMKQNITDIGYGLATVLALRAVEFDWIDGGKHDIGLIAQEVQPLVPEVVDEQLGELGQPTTFMLRKDALVAVLIKAVQELTARVEALEAL